MNPIRSKPDKRVFIVATCFTAALSAPCAYSFFKNGDPTPLMLVGTIMSFVFLNIRLIRFECTDSTITYSSLIKRKKIHIQDILGVRIGYPHDSGKAPKFIINTRSQGEVVIEVRALPLSDMQDFAKRLSDIGIAFTVDPAAQAQRMANQILTKINMEPAGQKS